MVYITSTVIVSHVLLKSWLILTNLIALPTLVMCHHVNILDMVVQKMFVLEVFPAVRTDYTFLVITMDSSNVTL